jgi:hypothetical protein
MDSGTELIVIIEEDHMDIETPEKITGKITQEVLSTRIMLKIFWIKTNMFSVIITSICKSYINITRKYSLSTWTRKTIRKSRK